MQDIQVSKFLSLILRHQPEVIGVILDENGWADFEELLNCAHSHGYNFSREQILKVVQNNDKQRFSFSEDGRKIRANQGHSIPINLNLEPQQPPAILFHGTATRFLTSIQQQGLHSASRQYVHLSSDEATAITVGKRHGKPIILRIQAGKMWLRGIPFYLSDNGIWLVARVPPEFIGCPNSFDNG